MSAAPLSAEPPSSGLRTEMHRRIDAFDWARTSVGPRHAWPRSLSSTIKTLLGSRYPMILLWGSELIQIYNEAYIKLIGDKHPEALGRSIRETQAESWEIIGPMIHEVMSKGVPNWVPAQRLPLERAGYREESYFSLSYSAVDDDRGAIAGMLCVCSEVTDQVLGERRLKLLRDVGMKATETHSVEVACKVITSALGEHPLDVPFAFLYLPDPAGQALLLESSVSSSNRSGLLPARVDLAEGNAELQPLLRAFAGETLEFVLPHLEPPLLGGPWGETAMRALAIPLRGSQQAPAFGVLVAGRSPNRALDESYASFYELLGNQVALAIGNARAHEDERKRAAAQLERGESMLRFLCDASATLAESLDYPTTLARITHLAVPLLADWCFIDILNEDGEVARMNVAHADPEDAATARALERFPAASTQNRENPPTRALLDGQAVLLENISDDQLRLSSHSEEHLAVMRQLQMRSFISVPLRARGRILGCLSLAMSKSNRRYGAADLALADDLARRCALAVDNARLYAQAQRAVNARDQFLAIASHELRTPLTPLQLQLHILERKAGDVARDARAQEWLESKLLVLRRQSSRLERLVNELLDVTQLTSGRLRVAPESLDLTDLAQGVLAAFEHSRELEQSGCTLEFRSAGPLLGYWDRHHLEQVLTYLLENALEFGPGKPVMVELNGHGSWARISVRDHGLGVPLEARARIFDRFERALPQHQYGGLGLGLWLVRGMVDAMGGRVTLDSAPQQGSTFHVDLPARAHSEPGR